LTPKYLIDTELILKLRKVGCQGEIGMNSGTRSGIRLLIAFMSFAFVFSVFFVSTPSTVVASSGNWTFIVRGSDVTFNADLWPPPSWYNYPAGSTPPTMAACAAGSGRVVAFGGSFAIRNSYVTLDVEQLIDATFRWLAKREDNVRSTIKVLWYEGYDVFYQNYKTNCGTLKNWLVSKGYTDSNIVADNTEPIADIPGLSSYDILFIPQLEPEASEAQEGIGGDPTLIPSSDYEAIRHFVEDLGKGLLILESADFSSSGPYGHSYYHVQNAIINNIENGMYFQSDTIKKDTSQYGGLDVPFVVGTAHWIGQSYLIDHGSTSCVLDSVCSMTVVPEQGPSVSIQLVQSFKYGAPGATLSYAVKVLNNGTIVDNYNLAASAGWVGVTLSTNKLINVEPLTTRTVSLSITIPSGASRGSSTNITVTATSENKPSLSKSAKGSAHAAPFSVDPVLGVWTSVYTSPRLMNYGVGVWGAGENIYILNNYSSSVGSCSDFTTYGRGDYFMRYNTVTGYWDDLTFPPFTLKNAAHNMCWDHGNYLYAVPGGSYADAASKVVHAFCRYNIANGSWETLPNTPMWQGPGDSLVWVKLGANEYIYAWLGTTSYSVILSKGNDPYAELWRFNISTNSWDSQFLRHVKGYLDYPSSGANQAQKDNGYGADDGCNLVWTGGDNIYYTPGAYTESLINKNEERRFLRYTISTNTLAEMSSPPDTGNGGFDDGGSMVYPGSGDYIYVIKGGDDTGSGGGSPGVAFWRYKISTNTWETLQNLPAGVGANNGCRIGYAGGGKIYYWVGPSSTASDKNLYVYGIESAGVDVSAPQNENSAASGMTVTFTVTVRTTGTVSDTYDLTVSGNASWSPILSQSSVGPLPPSVSSSVTLSVTIPSGTANGASQTITVTATSRANAAVTDSVSCIARCVTPPGVEVSISHTSKSGLSGSTLTYTVTVTNTGTASDTYTLTKSDSAVPNWSPSLSKDTVGPLAPGASDTAQLSVTIPSTAADGDSTTITVTATSRADAAVTDSVSCIARCVNPPGIEVSISPLSESGLSGSTLTYTVTVTNTGTASDTYTLTKNDSAAPSWSPSLSKDTVGPLAPGASGTAQLSVTIPAGTAEGVSHTITVTATSQASTTVKANASCVALAIEAIHPRVVVTISPSSRENENGGTLRYTVTVTNAGNVADDYTLSATDTLGWSLTLPSSIADVARNEDRTVTLTVGISDNAADGDSSTITVTATSSENTEVENSATCTARCATGETRVTSLTIFPSRFPLFPGYSGQVQSLTATLRVGNNPLPNKRITWAATAGSVSQSNGTTDALGQVSVYYTTPAVTVETPQVTITASFAGDAQYQASSGTSLGIPAIPISVNIPASTGGTVVITVIEINVTVNILVVPSNALSADTTITVVQAPRESISNYKMVSHVFNVGPSGTTFATSSTLTLPYDESELPVGVSEGDLAIYRRTSGGGWERVGGNVNTTANTVSAQIDHLSEYAVMSGLGGGGLPLLPIGVIVAVILIIAVIAVFIRRR
jgi:uncharacterized repeat protein (TIGR01451 family)